MVKQGEELVTEIEVFKKIVDLPTGEALLFCPTAMLSVSEDENEIRGVGKMGVGWKKVRVRKRVTDDGGMSRMAS